MVQDKFYAMFKIKNDSNGGLSTPRGARNKYPSGLSIICVYLKKVSLGVSSFWSASDTLSADTWNDLGIKD